MDHLLAVQNSASGDAIRSQRLYLEKVQQKMLSIRSEKSIGIPGQMETTATEMKPMHLMMEKQLCISMVSGVHL